MGEVGGGIKISEGTRHISFDLEQLVPAAVWCLEILQEVVLVDNTKAFFRKYRGSNFVLLAEKFSSSKGVFLKISKWSDEEPNCSRRKIKMGLEEDD